jgi:hypothetical protein
MQALRRSVIKSITGRYVYGLVIALVVGLLSWSSRCEEAWGEGGNWDGTCGERGREGNDWRALEASSGCRLDHRLSLRI